jgi:hypothetical protein
MNPEIKKYLKLILTMTMDCIMEGITVRTYITNLKAMIAHIESAGAQRSAGLPLL